MGLAFQMFLIDQEDHLYRLAMSKFDAMLTTPEDHRLRQFSGQRVRAANAVVELVNRRPTWVRRITYHVLTFDRSGCFDAGKSHRQEFGRYEQRMAEMISPLEPDAPGDTTVVDAASRFAAQGGTWAPSAALVRVIEDAVLGRVKTPRL